MLNITARNVNEALALGVMHFADRNNGAIRVIAPRGQTTLEHKSPVCTQYLAPMERVLFSEARDANPFFHLMEALWILAGRQDVAWLAQFNKNIASFSDNGVVFHAPYGYRLRYHFGIDQLEQVIYKLQDDPDTRQAVLQIWDGRVDLTAKSKDIPCNDLVMLKVRDGRLNATVACRSNDMIWGAYGANAVQFSVLQEFIARAIGVDVGTYHQVSDSFHVYIDNPKWEPLQRERGMHYLDLYADGAVRPYPLMTNADWQSWLTDLQLFITSNKDPENRSYQHHFFRDVAVPVHMTWMRWKQDGAEEALKTADFIAASDWRAACKMWLQRRVK